MQIGGLSSGIDTQSLIQQLMQLERKPLYNMQIQKHTYGLRKELFQEVNTSLSSLSKSISNLFTKTSFDQSTSTNSNESILSVSADAESLYGTYNIDVQRLATSTAITGRLLNEDTDLAAVNTSTVGVLTGSATDLKQTFADQGLGVTDGTIMINGVSIDVKATDSIETFMNRVNGSNAGVTLSYVTDNADADFKKFILTTDDVGSDAKITLSDIGSTNLFTELNLDTTTTYGSGTVDTNAAIGSAGIKYGGGTQYTEAGAISFKINNVAFNFDGSTDSLNDILETINTSGAGVTAFYDSDADQITFSNKATGVKEILFEDISGGFLDAIGVAGVDQTSMLGKTAHVFVNGAEMYKQSNSFDLNGINFNLKEVGVSTVTVEQDVDGIYDSIKDFVDKYNETIGLLNTRLSEEKVKGAQTDSALRKGLLRSDSTIMGIRTSLRSVATSQVQGLDNTYDTLMEIGIGTTSANFGISGELEIDETKLKEAIRNNVNSVKEFFFKDLDGDDRVDDDETGFAVKLRDTIDMYINEATSSVAGTTFKTGILPMKMDSMDKMIRRYDDDIDSFENRMEKVESRYWRQFTAMEKMMAQLNSQSSWLSSQLSAMPSTSMLG